MSDAPPIRYAKAGDVSIAYQVIGEGPLDVVWVPGLYSNLEMDRENPFHARLMRRLASFSRVVTFDKRGMGLSDRNVGAPAIEERMDDVRAVMDAAGSERAALIGVSEGGPMSIVFASTYPARTVALVLFGTLASVRRDAGYPWGNEEQIAELRRLVDEEWGSGAGVRLFARSLKDNPRSVEYAARMERAAGSPGTMRALVDTLAGIDVRSVLPAVSVPTLVIHTRDDYVVPIGNGRWLADHIAGARFVEIDGEHAVYDVDEFADEVEAFLTGERHAVTTDRVLSTVMFSDIVGSTQRASEMGDRRWKMLLDQHDGFARRDIDTHGGTLVKSTGDGILATFDGPARAVRCAQALCEGVRPLGIEIRAGLHTGEIELRGQDIGGIAVHIGQRVSALAGPGEVLVSRTVTDLVAGSGLEFEQRGEHELKGLPGTWAVYAVKS